LTRSTMTLALYVFLAKSQVLGTEFDFLLVLCLGYHDFTFPDIPCWQPWTQEEITAQIWTGRLVSIMLTSIAVKVVDKLPVVALAYTYSSQHEPLPCAMSK